MKIKVTAALVIVTVVLGVLCLTNYLFSDRIAPEITVPSAEITYEEGSEDAVLLEGVAAVDDRDGDISEDVRIYDVAVMGDGESAMVTYAVYDSSYNLAKAYKVVGYERKTAPAPSMQDEDVTTEAQTDDKKETTEAQTDDKKETTEAQTDDKKETTEAQTDDKKETTEAQTDDKKETTEAQTDDKKETTEASDGYDDPPLVSTGAPVMRLRTHEIHITVGGSFYSMDYVDTAVDDKDSKNALYEKMYLTGYYNTKKAGEYELTYYCIDSDDNVSNMAKLKMIVTELEQ